MLWIDYYAILNTLSANERRESNRFYEPTGKRGTKWAWSQQKEKRIESI
jgi:hypothetical protein